MRPQLLSTSGALTDLRAIEEYVAAHNPNSARQLARRLKSAVSRLLRFPNSGRVVLEFEDPKIREVISPPYRIAYSSGRNGIRILRLVHSLRHFSPFIWISCL